MRNTFKRIIALTFALMLLLSILFMTSCAIDFRNGMERRLDKVLSADSYTVSASNDDGSSYEFKVMDGAVYALTDYDGIKTTIYLFFDEAQGKYFEYSVADDGENKTKEKKELTASEYIAAFISMEATMGFSANAFTYRHILDMAEKKGDAYKYSTVSQMGSLSYRNIYTLESTDDGIMYTYEMTGKGVEVENTIEVTAINDTEFTIPEEAYTMSVTEQ